MIKIVYWTIKEYDTKSLLNLRRVWYTESTKMYKDMIQRVYWIIKEYDTKSLLKYRKIFWWLYIFYVLGYDTKSSLWFKLLVYLDLKTCMYLSFTKNYIYILNQTPCWSQSTSNYIISISESYK